VPFSHILGQDTVITTLTRALDRGNVHHAYRFEGPDGVGKELAAFALAQALVCTSDVKTGCGACDACRRAVTLANEDPRTPLHPDVTLIERGLYSAETIGRKAAETNEISINQIRRLVLSHAAFPPHEGRARVFIVRRAEELNVAAANALLKTLEEPRPNVHFILLTARGDRLLSTIRSRTLPVRFAPLSETHLRQILANRGLPADRCALAVELAAGSASTALELVDEEGSKSRDDFIANMLRAAEASDLGAALAIADARDRGRDMLRADLRALAASLARTGRADVEQAPHRAEIAARRYEATLRALRNVDRNASPNLTLATLVAEMQRAQ
jgi:DNA polymerase-3 subunit delta'